MAQPIFLLSVPGLRDRDLAHMPRLSAMAVDRAPLVASFPAVTCPVQMNLTTGCRPAEHGVVANGFYWREGLTPGRGPKTDGVEMWTAWDDVVQRPRIWDKLKEHDASLKSAVWFPLLAKGCGADFVCTFAPIHNPDGSESLWCYTVPEMLYGELRDGLGHFPLKHFWGPLANIESSRWIVSSLLHLLQSERVDFGYVYLPHLDYAAQKFGPDSAEASAACAALDEEIARLAEGAAAALGEAPLWLVASEYAITPVSHVAYPNRMLRGAGLLRVRRDEDDREVIDYSASDAWALADHQHSHVFVRDRDSAAIQRVLELFAGCEGIAEAWGSAAQAEQGLAHERTGDVVLVSESHSWQAYYWWEDDALAPRFARTVDIHRKPGYDPVEMFFDPALRQQHGGGTPLDATLVRGSHGAPPVSPEQEGVLLSSEAGLLPSGSVGDTDVFGLVANRFGLPA